MCVIIHKPRNIEICLKTIKKCFESNSDGVGIAIRQYDDSFLVVKGLFTINRVWKIISHLMLKEMIIHFRLCSSGNINEKMCHPFDIGENIDKSIYNSGNLIFHNGSNITCVDYKSNKTISDTYKLAILMKNLPQEQWRYLLYNEQKMTKNKYILVEDGNVYHYGSFQKQDNCWFSNLFWKKDWRMITNYKTDMFKKSLLCDTF